MGALSNGVEIPQDEIGDGDYIIKGVRGRGELPSRSCGRYLRLKRGAFENKKLSTNYAFDLPLDVMRVPGRHAFVKRWGVLCSFS